MIVCALLLFEGCDVMDVTGPYEVLLTANRLAERDGRAAPFDVRTVSVGGGPVTGYGGLGLTPSHGALGDVGTIDLLVVPGLIDLDAALADRVLVDAVRAAGARATTVSSVCTGAFLLDEAGLLGDAPATTHWEDVPLLAARRAAGTSTTAERRWVDTGAVITAGGISSGIDLGLHLVDRFAGEEAAHATARQIDHVWRETR